MENYTLEDESEPSEELVGEQGNLDSPEEGFLQGYEEEEEVQECAECGAAVRKEKKISKEINEETYLFCSKDCAEEFEDSLGKE